MAAKQEHEAVSLYRAVTSWTPTLTAASIVNTDNERNIGVSKVKVVSSWSQRDLVKSKKVSFERTDHCSRANDALTHHSHAISRTSNILMTARSDSGVCTAYVVTDKAGGKNADSKEQQYIEIWTENACWRVANPKDFDVHEDIITHEQFGTLSFSPDERFLLYVAQRKKQKSKSFFETEKKDSKESTDRSNDTKDATSRGEQFLYDQTWGEQFVGITCPVIVVYNIDKNEINVIDTSPFTDISAGQPQWTQVDDGIVFVGWENKPRKHGIVYCSNRRSSLYFYSFTTKKTIQLTKERDVSVYSPRVEPNDTNRVVYFSRPADGPHFSCSQLKVLDLTTCESRVVVDFVPRVTSALEFPGIYSLAMPKRCWSEDGLRVYFTSLWRSRQVILCVDLEHPNTVHRISPVDPDGSWIVQDVAEGLIVASFANPSCPTKLFCATLPERGDSVIQNWTELTHIQSLTSFGINWKLISLQHDGDDFSQSFEAILLTPKDGVAKCLAVCPHGGPHTAYSLDYFLTPSVMIGLGYAVLLVNYRGSIGFGQSLVEGLCGRVGTQDVKDVQHAVNVVLEKELGAGLKDKTVVWGGSHGGFLTTHLIGQFPDFCKAACVRNPVINIAGMTINSDIPDWCYVEGGVQYNSTRPNLPPAEEYRTMLECSPIRFVERVKTPLMIQLGDGDLRCPPSQGLQYYHALQSLGKESK
jgi:acylaminoacyl-peptidase